MLLLKHRSPRTPSADRQTDTDRHRWTQTDGQTHRRKKDRQRTEAKQKHNRTDKRHETHERHETRDSTDRKRETRECSQDDRDRECRGAWRLCGSTGRLVSGDLILLHWLVAREAVMGFPQRTERVAALNKNHSELHFAWCLPVILRAAAFSHAGEPPHLSCLHLHGILQRVNDASVFPTQNGSHTSPHSMMRVHLSSLAHRSPRASPRRHQCAHREMTSCAWQKWWRRSQYQTRNDQEPKANTH